MPRLNLPSPRRTVTKSVTLCRRLGYDEDLALHLIMSAAANAVVLVVDQGAPDPAWLRAVAAEAARRHYHLGHHDHYGGDQVKTGDDEEAELGDRCGARDDGRCAFCGSEDCDGSGYNCPDAIYDEYNLHDERLV